MFHVRDGAARELALKLLTAQTPGILRRFQREGEVTARLRHPGIVSVHAAGEDQGRPYLVYELVSGASLAERLPGLDRPARLRLVREVAEAVGYAHSQGVLHRDLKAENVVVDAAGHARVVDFGLAQVADAERLTRTGAWVGSPASMSPEQIAGARERFGPPTDVWGLGVLLYLALVDRLPFEGSTVVEFMAQVSAAAPEAPRALDPTIDAALERVCLTALTREPQDRYPDGTAFAAALGAACSPDLPGEPAPRGRRLEAGLAVVAVAATVAIAVALQAGRKDRPTSGPAPATQSLVRAPTPSPEELVSQAREAAQVADAARIVELLEPLLERPELPVAARAEAEELLAGAYAFRAEGLRRAGDLAGAGAALDAACALAPSLTLVHLERAWLLSDQGQPAEALRFFARALQANPTQASAHFGRGLCLERLGSPREALEAFEQAVALSEKPRYAVRLARTRESLGDLVEAVEGIAQALARGAEGAGRAELLLERGRLRLALGAFSEALADCDAALVLVPQDPRALELRRTVSTRLAATAKEGD
ncbi:MAG: protein kinase [Planctomycetes bacterium]|nr:protein kinase [Planctomycetota bacterium]